MPDALLKEGRGRAGSGAQKSEHKSCMCRIPVPSPGTMELPEPCWVWLWSPPALLGVAFVVPSNAPSSPIAENSWEWLQYP